MTLQEKPSWSRYDIADEAENRILDAAATVVLSNGIRLTSMDAVARAAGCSRATLYRYFDTRQALQAAFVQREAIVVAAQVRQEITKASKRLKTGPDVLLFAVQTALRIVRDNPILSAWFRPGDAGTAVEEANRSELIVSLAQNIGGLDFLDDDAARWLVRVLLSFLVTPGANEKEEQDDLRRFLAPVILLNQAS